MRPLRISAALLALIALALPVVVYIGHVRWLGFPDGHLTELDRAERLLYGIAIWPCLGLGLWSLSLARAGAGPRAGRRLAIAGGLLVLNLALAAGVRWGLSLTLDSGQGG